MRFLSRNTVILLVRNVLHVLCLRNKETSAVTIEEAVEGWYREGGIRPRE